MEETKDESSMYGALERNWLQITPKRDVVGDNFERGVIDIDYSIGGRFAWRPSKSYFRIGLELTRLAGTVQPLVADNLAFSDNPCAALFDNVYVRGGGADISSIVNYAPQAGQVKARLGKTRSWLNSVGKSAFGCSADFDNRVNMVSSDGITGEEDTISTSRSFRIGGVSGVTVAVSSATKIDGVNTTWDTVGSPYRVVVGDTINIKGEVKVITAVVSDTELTAAGLTNPVAATTNAFFTSPTPQISEQRNIVYFHYIPSTGIWDYPGLLGSGEYRVQLNPNTRYKTSIVQSFLSKASGTDYNINVTDIQFFACIEKANVPVTGIEKLFLTEQHIQSKAITGTNQVFDFTVPPSTQSIAVFIQSSDAGSNTQVPLTLFKTKDETDMRLTQIQLTYANTTKPSTNWSSDYKESGGAGNTNFMVQRYLDTQIASGLYYTEGGTETFLEWQKRGPLYLFDFSRDSSDRSTNLQLSLAFSSIEANAQVLVCANYTRAVQISSNNGYITQIQSLSV